MVSDQKFEQITRILDEEVAPFFRGAIWSCFDSIPHNPLLQKLEEIGISQFILKWVQNYLTERKHYLSNPICLHCKLGDSMQNFAISW